MTIRALRRRCVHHAFSMLNQQGMQVASIEELFISLRADVEAVFMQAPTVDLEALATRVDSMKPDLEALASFSCC